MTASDGCSVFSVYTHDMPGCAIKSCKSRSATHTLQTNGITFHLFPKSGTQRKQWVEATGQTKSWQPTRTSTICSRHFTPECFAISKNNRRTLFDIAMPTLFLSSESPETTDTPSILSGPVAVSTDRTAAAVVSAAPSCLLPNINMSSKELIKCVCSNAVVVGTRMRKLEYVTKKQKQKIKHLQYAVRKEKKKMNLLKEKLEILQKHLELTDDEFKALTASNTPKPKQRLKREKDIYVDDVSLCSEDSDEEPFPKNECSKESTILKEETPVQDPLNYYMDAVIKSEEDS